MDIAKKCVPVLFCLMALLLSACSVFGGDNTSAPKKLVKAPVGKQLFVVPQVGISDLTTLDPALALASDTPSLSAIQMIFTGLVQLDDHLRVQPQLAQSWHL